MWSNGHLHLSFGPTTHAIGRALASSPMRTAAAGLALGAVAGLISLRAHHPTERVPPPAIVGHRERGEARADIAAGTLLDDLMLVALVVGLVACAVFVWLNLGRLMADG